MSYFDDKEKLMIMNGLMHQEMTCKESPDLSDACHRATQKISFDRFEREIRRQAITEFAERLKKEYAPCKDTDSEIYENICKRIDEIAKEIGAAQMNVQISKSALLKELESNKIQPTKDADGFIDGWCEGFNTVVDMIRNMPATYT